MHLLPSPAGSRCLFTPFKLRPLLLVPSALVSSSSIRRAHTTSNNVRRPSPSIISHHQAPTTPTLQTRLSTTTTSQPPASSLTSSPPSLPHSPPATHPPLTWSTFLRLRRTRRFYNLIASISSSSLTLVASMAVISTLSQDVISTSVFGLDPIMTMGLATVAAGGFGWLVGPIAGNAVFGMVYKGWRTEMRGKERAFYARIKKHRADPASQSMANPVPDYYGEKIDSVGAYRQWLKDQRAFTKKRQIY